MKKSDILIAHNLTKIFHIHKTSPGLFGAIKGLFSSNRETIQAVKRINFSVDSGETVGLIGPNGAGKSTTIKMVTGILRPTSGWVKLFGMDPVYKRKECAYRYGVVFGQRSQLWWHLPVGQTFEALSRIYSLDKREARKSREYLTEVFELTDFLNTPVRQLSLGQRSRANIAASLLHRPDILFLDEPTIGVDVVGKARMRDYIQRINKEFHVTVILTSHDMIDIERICRRVIIIDGGTILYDGSLKGLLKKVTTERWLIVDLAHQPKKLEFTTARLVDRQYNRITLVFKPHKHSTPEVIREIAKAYKIIDFTIQDPPIDKIISDIYSHGLSGKQEEKI